VALQTAVIGMGYWGPHYARLLDGLRGARLRWCCDPDPAALNAASALHPQASMARDPREVLDDPGLDAVVIATPTTTHAQLTVAALRAGKDVLVEKPLATSEVECRAIEAAIEDNVLLVGHTFLYSPPLAELRRVVQDGELGKVRYIASVRAADGPVRDDVNVLWDLAPHDVAIYLDLVPSRPVSVSAVGQAYQRDGVEDVVHLNVRFENGVLATAHLSWIEPQTVRRVTVVGDREMAIFDDRAPDGRLKIVRGPAVAVPSLPAAEPLAEQLEAFLSATTTRERPYSDLELGARVVSVIGAAQESLANGGAPVSLAGESLRVA
jgi:predicted dehydrogenase